jgi:hypothetical protein
MINYLHDNFIVHVYKKILSEQKRKTFRNQKYRSQAKKYCEQKKKLRDLKKSSITKRILFKIFYKKLFKIIFKKKIQKKFLFKVFLVKKLITSQRSLKECDKTCVKSPRKVLDLNFWFLCWLNKCCEEENECW